MSNKILNKSSECANCGHAFEHDENFCPNCGQKNTDLNISVWDLIKDFLGDYFSFDSHFLNTIPPLLFRPGKVPKEYIEGQRVKHIPPLRIFIFLSFISFFLWGLSFDSNIGKESGSEEDLVNFITDSVSTNSEDIGIDNDGKLDTLINGINFSVDTTQAQNNSINISKDDLSFVLDKSNKPKQIVDSLASEVNIFWQRAFYQALRVYQAKDGEVVSYLLSNISLVLLLMQPFFALLLKLFYIRRKEFFYLEHLVFSLYFHSFILLLTVLLFIISLIIEADLPILIMMLISFIYLIGAIKYFYKQSFTKSLIKGIMISLVYIIVLFPVFTFSYLVLSLYFY